MSPTDVACGLYTVFMLTATSTTMGSTNVGMACSTVDASFELTAPSATVGNAKVGSPYSTFNAASELTAASTIVANAKVSRSYSLSNATCMLVGGFLPADTFCITRQERKRWQNSSTCIAAELSLKPRSTTASLPAADATQLETVSI
ncbi:unnamed protein product [Phytophthora lilii]|uniref:Unnamed protein product n=1 Tax=Phytophthora lilii TaxID=2077276 RepID=A0A9W6U7W7_9STRA|nr:unnamed protein product [Phytophthora lilii]